MRRVAFFLGLLALAYAGQRAARISSPRIITANSGETVFARSSRGLTQACDPVPLLSMCGGLSSKAGANTTDRRCDTLPSVLGHMVHL
jgi:hypothetical protein